MSVLIFFVVLFVLILVHEWGHFITAKKTGMRVDEFGIGFPPKLYGKKKGETEYTLNALPIGGFVRIWGENYEDVNNATEGVDKSRGFSSRPKWAQAVVLVAGVVMNILFAWFLFSITYMVGVQTPVEEATATESAQLYISGVLPDSPAAVVPAGSAVTSVTFNGDTIAQPLPSEFSRIIAASAGDSVTITYDHGGDEGLSAVLNPVQGLITDDTERYAVGASLSLLEVQRQGFLSAVGTGFESTWRGLISISVGLWSLLSQIVGGDADFSQVAGPVGIVGMVGDAAAFGFTALLTFTAIISLNLAVINLLPFPALDGGRLVFVLIESITRKQIPPEWAGRVNLVGFALLMVLMVTVTYNDILRLL